MIKTTWFDWQEKPTTLNIIEDSPISSIPFPTVTICPATKVIKDKFNIDEKFMTPWHLVPNLTDRE